MTAHAHRGNEKIEPNESINLQGSESSAENESGTSVTDHLTPSLRRRMVDWFDLKESVASQGFEPFPSIITASSNLRKLSAVPRSKNQSKAVKVAATVEEGYANSIVSTNAKLSTGVRATRGAIDFTTILLDRQGLTN